MAEDMERGTEKRNNGLDIRIIAIGLVIFLAAMGGSYYIAHSIMSPFLPKENKKAASRMSGTPVDMGEFIVNIPDVSGNRYLKAGVCIGISNPKDLEEVEAQKPIIRDEILTILSSKTLADLDWRQRNEIKNQIKTRLNDKLGDKITDVYFTTFITQ